MWKLVLADCLGGVYPATDLICFSFGVEIPIGTEDATNWSYILCVNGSSQKIFPKKETATLRREGEEGGREGDGGGRV